MPMPGRFSELTREEQLVETVIEIVNEWQDDDIEMASSEFIELVEEAVQEFREAGEI